MTILILAVIIGFNFFGRKKQTPLQFVSVKKQDIKATISGSGTLTGKDVANLKFRTAGKLSYINVKIGDKVTKGQAVAGLDTQDLTIALQQAQNTLRDKEAIAEKAEDDVKDHSDDESFAQKATRTTAQAARDSAFDAVKAAQRDFQDAIIISPIDGIVTGAIQVSGQTVSSADVITRIVDTSSLYFDTDIDEADIGKVALNQSVEINLDAYADQIFSGNIDQILPQTRTTAQGATVVTTRVKLDHPKILLVDGLTGQASIITDKKESALTIPQEALRDDNTVVLQEGKQLVIRKVVPGIRSDTDVEIKEGLAENEQVAINPPAPGTNLNPRSTNPLGNAFRFLRGGSPRSVGAGR